MSEDSLTHEELLIFFRMVKEKKVVSVRDLTSKEIEMAERLVSAKLLSKLTTNINSFYTYGVERNNG